MSRFGTYLQAQKLAKALVMEAELKVRKKETDAAVGYLIRGVQELALAMNNLASMQFEPKRKVTR